MTVDYDLVIIGATAAGIHAANLAARWKARVVLVEQGVTEHSPAFMGDRILGEIGRTLEQARRATQLGLWQTADSNTAVDPTTLWKLAQHWADTVSSAVEASQSAAVLASRGVEVISGCGEFCRKPALGFTIQGRVLRSRAYLLTTGCCSVVPEIDGLATAKFLTPATLIQQQGLLQRVTNLVVIGGDATGAALAQAMVRMGITVTIITPEAQILPEVDPEIACLVQAQLEAAGVRVLPRTTISQIKLIQGKKWVQAGNQAIEADEILLATGQQPNLYALNLDAAGISWQGGNIATNQKLQTSNPRIYACPGNIGSDYTSHVATDAAAIALKNALIFPCFRATRRSLPRLVCTDPPLAWIGLTEPQAMQHYGKDVMILRQTFAANSEAQLRDETTGLCKLIVRRNGTILGAHLLGTGASEWMSAMLLAMQQNLNIRTLAALPLPDPTFAQILRCTASEWNRLRLKRNVRLLGFLEKWFATLRSWS